MTIANRATRLLPPLQVWLGPVVVTLFLWFTRADQVSGVEIAAAFLLLLFPWWSYHRWRQTGARGLPIFAAVAVVYWLYFSMPLFWGDRSAADWRYHHRLVSDTAVNEVMLLVVFGVACLWLGMRCSLGHRLAPKRLPDIHLTPWSILYIQGVALAGTLMSRYQQIATAGEGTRQIVYIIEGTASLAAILILFRRIVDGQAAKFEKAMLAATLIFRIVLGVSSGWLGAAAALGLSCAFVYMHRHRKIPIAFIACLMPYMLFFQAGKEQFRQVFWHDQVEATPLEKGQFWMDASLKAWQEAFDDPSGKQMGRILSFSLARTSLLTLSANVLDLTPSVVPYQYGRLYSYFAVALIPRFLWPEKPSMNEANQFYQVAYGITREQDLDKVSIAVGTLTEGYINFGWYGVAGVMFLIGIFLDFWNETFLSRSSTRLAFGIGMALVPQLLLPEYQLAQYASGIIQHVALTVLVFLPIMRLRTLTFTPGRNTELGMASVRP